MWTSSRSIAAFTFVFTTAITVLAAEQPSPAKSDTYTWNGELVSFDTTANTMTVKVRVAYPDVVSQLKHIAAGERVWIVWSGVHDFSDAVRQVRRAESRSQISEDLALPAELVSTEAPNQYITMRVKVPETSLAAIQTVKPGTWVTVTSRHRPSTDDAAVVAVTPYGSAITTTN
jgi:hypothetical protein